MRVVNAVCSFVALILSAGACGASDDTAATGGSSTSPATGTVADTESDTRPQGTRSLVAVEGWVADDAPPPSLVQDAPETVTCENGWGVEDGVFEVDSEFCNWGAFAQPSLVPIKAGDTLEVILLHDALFSDDPDATAHVAVAVGDLVVWETTLMIPAAAGLVRPAVLATADAPAGTPVHVHVHNHGYNNYRFVDITVTP